MSNNVIVCPNCNRRLHETDVAWESSSNPDCFNVTCKPCGHKWEAHHRDFKSVNRNPFQPINITPYF
jgi:RNase P subunit RPR2